MSLLDDVQAFVVRQVRKEMGGPNAKIGVVAATSPLSVTFFGDSSSVPVSLRLATYTPAEGDKVLLQRADNRWVVVGEVVS